MTDAMDKAAGIAPDDALYATRRFRPEFVQGAEACRLAVLQPANDQGLERDLRLALARRMAALNADAALLEEYDRQLAELRPSERIQAVASGKTDLNEPLATIVRHVDLITLTPSRAEAKHIAALAGAGLNNPQIVALSELIAFVNFQTRVVAGLRLLRSA